MLGAKSGARRVEIHTTRERFIFVLFEMKTYLVLWSSLFSCELRSKTKPVPPNHLTPHDDSKSTAVPVSLALTAGQAWAALLGYTCYDAHRWGNSWFESVAEWTDTVNQGCQIWQERLHTTPNRDIQPRHSKRLCGSVLVGEWLIVVPWP